MNEGIVAQLEGLVRERSRLDALLAADPNWQVYCEHIDAQPGFLESQVAGGILLPEDVISALKTNRLFQARSKILEAIDLLQDLLARESHSDEHSEVTEHDIPLAEVIPVWDETPKPAPEPTSAPAHEAAASRTSIKVKTLDGAPTIPQGLPALGSDDITRIKFIDEALAQQLNQRGIHTFAAIAKWTRDDVKSVRAALDLERRISQENWIEQAALLARPGLHAPRLRSNIAPAFDLPAALAHANEPAWLQPVAPAPTDALTSEPKQPDAPVLAPLLAAGRSHSAVMYAIVSALVDASDEIAPVESPHREMADTSVPQHSEPPPLAAAANDDVPDDLTYIRGLSRNDASVLREAGVTRFAAISNWTARDVTHFRELLNAGRKICTDQWIEQAAILAKGGITRFGDRLRRGETQVTAVAPAQGAWQKLPLPQPVVTVAEPAADVPRDMPPPLPPVAVADRATLSLPAERLPPPPLPARRPMPAMSALTDRHTGPNAANPFEAKEPGFSERLAQIEKTRSNIVLPDLRRPPPTLGSGAPPLEVAKASRPVASAASTLIDTGAPPKPPLTPEPAAAPDEPDGGRLVGDTASEADVQIVMVDSEQRDRPAVGLEAISITDTDGPPEPPPSFWKRRGRRSMSDDTASTQRATGPIEEASVHIIHANTDRPPPVSTRNDLDHVATPTEPDDRTRKKARQRFLQALIGTTEKS